MKKCIVGLCLVLILLSFISCKAWKPYMEDYVDVQWTCDEIELQFSYTSDNPELAFGTITKNGETIEICCEFTVSRSVEIYKKEGFSFPSEGNEGTSHDETIMIGDYNIKDDTATVTILKDTLFDGEYVGKVIHLQKTAISK